MLPQSKNVVVVDGYQGEISTTHNVTGDSPLYPVVTDKIDHFLRYFNHHVCMEKKKARLGGSASGTDSREFGVRLSDVGAPSDLPRIEIEDSKKLPLGAMSRHSGAPA